MSLQSNGNGLRVGVERARDARTEELHADIVVGADGALSRVAQAAGWPRQPTVPLVQAIVRLPADMSPDTVRVWFVPDDTPYFYWLIPESRERAALGLIGEDGQETRRCLERFMEKRGFTPLGFQGARIPVYDRWTPVERRVGAGRVFLVGDAAGQVKVTTVGGIVTGFRGALGVSEAILNGGESRELRSLRRELDLHLLIRKTIHQFKQADYSRLVDLMNASTRRSLSQYTRDEAARVLWHITLSQPRLLLLGLRGTALRRLDPSQESRLRRLVLGRFGPGTFAETRVALRSPPQLPSCRRTVLDLIRRPPMRSSQTVVRTPRCSPSRLWRPVRGAARRCHHDMRSRVDRRASTVGDPPSALK